MTYEFKGYSTPIVFTDDGPACYGPYRRRGWPAPRFRNYHRPIKGGLTFGQLIGIRVENTRTSLQDMISESVWGGSA